MQRQDEVAVFIDLENVATSLHKSAGQQPNASRLIAHARKYGPIAFARAYADFSTDLFRGMESSFRNANIEPFHCPAKVRGEVTQSTVDMNLGVDMYETAQDRPTIGTYVLMAGDSDYIRVVARLRYRFDKADLALQLQRNTGASASEFGITPVKNAVSVVGVVYY